MLQIKSKYKVCKRLGSSVFEQCQTQKFSLSEARSRKGRSGRRRPRALSDYGKQLIEKQKVRFMYGLSERQFSRYVHEAMGASEPPLALHQALEMRLDNVAYRLGLVPTRRAARQLVSHGHLTVNGRRMTVPSHRVRVGDTVAVREGSRESGLFTTTDDDKGAGQPTPPWLTLDMKAFSAQITGMPTYSAGDSPVDYTAVFEFYSR